MATRSYSALLAGVVASSILVTAEISQAASLQGPNQNLQGINDLQIGSFLVDVGFASGSFNSAYGPNANSPVPRFLNDAAGATTAVNAINAFFNSVGFGDQVGPPGPTDGIQGSNSDQYLIPFFLDNSGGFTAKRGRYNSSDWASVSDFSASSNAPANQTPSFAVFSNARAVPTPALLPGILGFGMSIVRKRKKQRAV